MDLLLLSVGQTYLRIKKTDQNKALEIYSLVSYGGKMFVASRGWLQRFLQRYSISLRRRSSMGQRDPDQPTKLAKQSTLVQWKRLHFDLI